MRLAQSAAAVDADADADTDTNTNTGTAESSPSTGILSKAKRNAMVIIGSDPRPVEFNSVVILPRLITADECHVLVDSCDQRCNYLKYFASLNPALPTDGSRWHAMHRVPIKDLSSKEAKELSNDILFNRPVLCQYFTLLLQREVLEYHNFHATCNFPDLPFAFSRDGRNDTHST